MESATLGQAKARSAEIDVQVPEKAPPSVSKLSAPEAEAPIRVNGMGPGQPAAARQTALIGSTIRSANPIVQFCSNFVGPWSARCRR